MAFSTHINIEPINVTFIDSNLNVSLFTFHMRHERPIFDSASYS